MPHRPWTVLVRLLALRSTRGPALGWLSPIGSAPSAVALALITGYQRHLSPRKGFECPYRLLTGGPSCSSYARARIAGGGVRAGVADLRQRLIECRRAAHQLAHASATATTAADQTGFGGSGPVGIGSGQYGATDDENTDEREKHQSEPWPHCSTANCQVVDCGSCIPWPQLRREGSGNHFLDCDLPNCDVSACDIADCSF